MADVAKGSWLDEFMLSCRLSLMGEKAISFKILRTDIKKNIYKKIFKGFKSSKSINHPVCFP